MLPVESGVIGSCSGIVLSRLDMSQEDSADARAAAVAVGSDKAGGCGRAVRAHPWGVERTNCQIVLLADEGRHAPEIAWLVRRGPHQVRKVLRRFQAEGLADLTRRTAAGRAVQVTPA